MVVVSDMMRPDHSVVVLTGIVAVAVHFAEIVVVVVAEQLELVVGVLAGCSYFAGLKDANLPSRRQPFLPIKWRKM